MRCPKLLSTMLVMAGALPSFGGEPNTKDADFFERRIRPVMVKHCYKCHSRKSKVVQGKLRLDDRAALRKGGESGPVVVPGKPQQSLLLKALKHDGLEMPPSGKLPANVIADFRTWIARGAVDPRRGKGRTKDRAAEIAGAAKTHWAFQPIRLPKIPAHAGGHTQTPIDHFVLARLQSQGLTQSPAASRAVLIRRLYIDLLGMPPTYAEIKRFEQDRSPDAFEKVVERVLASPHYGERWARHWLDVARYADTKDLVLLYGKDAIHPYAYTYRDYVVAAFNRDTPFDRFVHEQLAADQLTTRPHRDSLAAMGFLTLSRNFCNMLPEQYDDRIDVVTRGFLALTVSCARCHDHKYDPIPTDDYYSLYGIFASSETPIERPLLFQSAQQAAKTVFEKKAAPVREKLRKHIDTQHALQSELARQRIVDYLIKVTQKPDPLETAVFYLSLSPEDLRPQILARWRRFITRKTDDDPVFGLWKQFTAAPAAQWSQVVTSWRNRTPGNKPGQVDAGLQNRLQRTPVRSLTELAQLYGQLMLDSYKRVQSKAKDITPTERRWAALLTSRQSPAFIPRSHAYLYMSRVPRTTYHKTLLDLDKLAIYNDDAPGRGMVLVDSPVLYDPRIFVRGNPNQLGRTVPRRFLQVIEGDKRQAYNRGSGRLRLAQAITSRRNPLTARVIVNRVWMHHFGRPLVSTPSDFGLRSRPPTHPKLLDYLAWHLRHGGWSIKNLHRWIVLSHTYRQSSGDNAAQREKDPENQWLWRMNRRRLELEAMRDSLLAISGRLDRRLGGRPVQFTAAPQSGRRTIYGLVDRQNLASFFRAFDFASPDQSSAKRPQTIVPQQALFALNSKFVILQAQSLARSISGKSAHEKVRSLYQRVYSRDPEPAELKLAIEFVKIGPQRAAQGKLNVWEQLAQILLVSNELMFVD